MGDLSPRAGDRLLHRGREGPDKPRSNQVTRGIGVGPMGEEETVR
jgi:hypothetical protein